MMRDIFNSEEDERDFDDLEDEENLKDTNGVTDDIALKMTNKNKNGTAPKLDVKKGGSSSSSLPGKEGEENKEEEVKREFIYKEPLKYHQRTTGKDGSSYDFDYFRGDQFKQFIPRSEYEDLYDTSCSEAEDALEKEDLYGSDQEELFTSDEWNDNLKYNDNQNEFKKIGYSPFNDGFGGGGDEEDISTVKSKISKKKKIGIHPTKSVFSFTDSNSSEEEREYDEDDDNLFGSVHSKTKTKTKKRKIDELDLLQQQKQLSVKKKKIESSSDSQKSDLNSNGSSSEGIIDRLEITSNLSKIEESKKNKTFPKKGIRGKTYICFGCMYQDPDRIPVDKTILSELMQDMCRLIGKISTYNLAKVSHIYFMKKIWHPMRAEGHKIPIWRSWQIYDHIRNHVQDPRFWIVSTMEKLKIHENNIEHSLYKYCRSAEDGQEYPVIDKEMFKLYLETQKQILFLYGKKTNSLNFYNENVPVKMDEIGASISLTKNFVTKIKYHNH